MKNTTRHRFATLASSPAPGLCGRNASSNLSRHAIRLALCLPFA